MADQENSHSVGDAAEATTFHLDVAEAIVQKLDDEGALAGGRTRSKLTESVLAALDEQNAVIARSAGPFPPCPDCGEPAQMRLGPNAVPPGPRAFFEGEQGDVYGCARNPEFGIFWNEAGDERRIPVPFGNEDTPDADEG